MGSLASLPTADVVAQVLARGPERSAEVHEQLVAAHEAAWQATSPRLLELCRVRIAMLLGCQAEVDARTPGTGVDDATLAALAAWPTDARFGAAERACLALTEHFVIDVASLDDGTVEAVRAHLGDDGVYTFVSALLVVEQRIRMRLTWDQLFGGS